MTEIISKCGNKRVDTEWSRAILSGSIFLHSRLSSCIFHSYSLFGADALRRIFMPKVSVLKLVQNISFYRVYSTSFDEN